MTISCVLLFVKYKRIFLGGKRWAYFFCLASTLAIELFAQAEIDGSNEYNDFERGSINTTYQLVKDLKNIDMVMHIGDICYASGYLSQWDQFTELLEFFFLFSDGGEEFFWRCSFSLPIRAFSSAIREKRGERVVCQSGTTQTSSQEAPPGGAPTTSFTASWTISSITYPPYPLRPALPLEFSLSWWSPAGKF